MAEKKSILNKLLDIQGKLKAPKGQTNAFGKYKYRSCEDILEAVKPLCVANEVSLTLTDDLVMIGERYYVKATATLHDVTSEDKIEVSSFAREEDTKKGMDQSQITGASSSYARKYALNGLFNIDDTKDSDVTNLGLTDKKTPIAMISPDTFIKRINEGADRATLTKVFQEITMSQKITAEEKKDLVAQIKAKIAIIEKPKTETPPPSLPVNTNQKCENSAT